METVIRNVKDIGTADRQALEHVIGQRLTENQQIVINVLNLDVARPSQPSDPLPAPRAEEVPPWWRIYDGLDDVEVDRLDQAIRQRANLTLATK